MGSLNDGDAFVQATQFVARTQNIGGGRVLLRYLAERQRKLPWSNDHFAAVSQQAWVPAQDWRLQPLPPAHRPVAAAPQPRCVSGTMAARCAA